MLTFEIQNDQMYLKISILYITANNQFTLVLSMIDCPLKTIYPNITSKKQLSNYT